MSIYDKSSLVLIPSGTKTGKVYSQKPTNGDGDFTFTRASAATRVNADGNIEKETSNLLLQSNSFNTTWIKSSTSVTSGQTGYDGTSDAWELERTGTSGFIYQLNAQSGVITFSFYAKANSLSWIRIVVDSGTNAEAYINLSNGSIGGGGSYIDVNTYDVGNDWYRISITHNDSAHSNYRIYPAVNDGDISGTSGSIYIQDAQLNQGLIAQEVITTTTSAVYGGITDNVPRLDYTDSSCPSLLLEPSRTNAIPFSEYQDAWDVKSNISIQKNNAISPEGVVNASNIYPTATGASFLYQTLVYTIGTTYTYSVFAKANGKDYLQIATSGASWASNVWCTFDLALGATDNNGFQSVGIEDYGNGWYRCYVTEPAISTSSSRIVIGLVSNANAGRLSSITPSGTDGVLIYGVVSEAGSYATSYIPTYGSSVTFAADDCDAVSATSLIGQSEGTLFLDFVANDEDSLQIIYQVRTTGSTNVGQIDFRIQSGNLRALGNDGGTTQFNISAGAAVTGTRYKCAVRYANNNVAFYVNGVLKGTDASASFSSSSLDQITFNENGTTFYPSVNVNQALIIPTALLNTELADLTTL